MKTFLLLLRRQRLTLLTFLTFFLSVVLLGVLVNLFSTLLQILFGSTPQRLAILVFGLVLTALLLYGVIGLLGRETRRWLPLPREMHARPHAGLIALVGPGPNRSFLARPEDSPAAAAIRYHLEHGTLQHVWLIASDEGVPVAEALRELYGHQVVIHFVLPPIHNILDIGETFEAAVRVAGELPALGLSTGEVIADYTGATSPMSVGLALAALRSGFAMEFMSRLEGSASVPLQTDLQGGWRLDRGEGG